MINSILLSAGKNRRSLLAQQETNRGLRKTSKGKGKSRKGKEKAKDEVFASLHSAYLAFAYNIISLWQESLGEAFRVGAVVVLHKGLTSVCL
jgi:hypothetical protein